MEQDEQWLKTLVASRTQDTWDKRQQPYYISFIATDAIKEGVDYRPIIAPLKLRQWALSVEIEGVKAVAHPLHTAKAGFVPLDKDYTFDDADVAQASAPSTKGSGRVTTRRSTLQFLETLGTLSDDELDGIVIPVRTIVRLLNG